MMHTARRLRGFVMVGLAALAVANAAGPHALAQSKPGAIRGRVDLGELGTAPGHRPAVVDRTRPPVPADEPRRAVVYLETAPRGAFDDLGPRRARLDQRNEMFVPHVIAIQVGTTVDFPNNDRTYHNVFSLSKVKSFDLGRYAAGHSKAVTFDRPGIVRVFCDIHSHMNAWILVFAHPFFAVTEADGRFRIENVPPGTYTVAVWNEAGTAEPRSVVVTAGGETDVTFALGRKTP
jgi:plastocyanin